MENGSLIIRELIDGCFEKCLRGEVLTKDEIVSLLNIPVLSEEDMYLRRRARETAALKTADQGFIWCAVGMDFAPCEMNCRFCSFGSDWNVIKEARHVTKEEIIESVRRYAEGGAAYIVLRTTEFYDIEKLLDYIPKIRKEVPGDYVIILNTGELDDELAEKVAAGGVYGIYHALRLREGVDTPFDPAVRIKTMKSVSASSLKLISLTEPVGPEHSSEELADAFLNTVACRALIGGMMARFPVEGTPLGNTEMLSDDEIAHNIAVFRLSGGDVIKNICVHPASEQALSSGANVMVVECGAIPRDECFCESDWADTDMKKAAKMLESNGFILSKVL